MLAGSARLEQLLWDAPDVGAAEYLVGPGLGELEPDDAPVQAGTSTCPRRSRTPTHREGRDVRRRGPRAPPGRYSSLGGSCSPGALPRCPRRRRTGSGAVRRGCPRGSRWGEGFAGTVPLRGHRSPVPPTGPSGEPEELPRCPRRRRTPSGAAGTRGRVPVPRLHRGIVRYVRRVGHGGAPLAPPWCPVGKRRGGAALPGAQRVLGSRS